MSVLVALVGSDAAVVATDSRRIGPDGKYRDDFPKTFKLPKASIIGGFTGLLEFSNRTVPEWLETLPLTSLATLDHVVREAKILFEKEMSAISENEVSLRHRIVDIVLVGHDDLREKSSAVSIRAIVLRPDTSSNQVLAETHKDHEAGVTGDDNAKNAVLGHMHAMGLAPRQLPRERLATTAKHLVEIGVRSAGVNPNFPCVISCGGPASIVFL